MKLFTIIICLLSSTLCLALDRNKCAAMVNKGWLRTYKYGGPWFHGMTASTNDLQKSPLKATMQYTNESTTASSDTGYSSNTSTSQTQSTSSTGECHLFAYEVRKQRLDGLLAYNDKEVKEDIANVDGKFIAAVSELSLCREDLDKSFSLELSKNYSRLLEKGKLSSEKILNLAEAHKNYSCQI